MSGKASGCWLDAATPELLPVICSRNRTGLQPLVSPAELTVQENPAPLQSMQQVLLFAMLSENNNNNIAPDGWIILSPTSFHSSWEAQMTPRLPA